MSQDQRFSINDVLGVAVALEESAGEVYRAAADQAKSSELRETLLGLAEMEEDHRITFDSLRSSLSGAAVVPPSAEMVELFAAWLDERVFAPIKSLEELDTAGSDITSWLETGVGMEKESIAFYSGMRELIDAEHRPAIDAIIEEELRHMVTLSGLLRQLCIG